MSEIKEYRRFPIQIHEDTFILLHIYNRKSNHSFESAWLSDNQHFSNKEYSVYKDAADQLIKQFEGEECELFIRELRDRCDKYLKDKE